MRWEGLFADLEGQLAAEQRRELDDEVAERTRRERALVTLPARLAAAVGEPVRISLPGGLQVDGDLHDLGEDWVLVRTTPDAHEVLVPLAAVVTLRSLGSQSAPARTARRFGLGYALRALSRDRATVVVSRASATGLAAGNHRRRRGRPPRPRRAPRGAAAPARERQGRGDGAVRGPRGRGVTTLMP